MQIRPFKLEDSDACVEIFQSNAPDFFDHDELAEFQTFLSHPNSEFFVVVIDDAVRACGGHYKKGSEGWLCWGMVHRNLHGKRIGRELLVERLRRLFSDQAVSTVSINTSQHSRPFFEHFRFTIVGAAIPNGFGKGMDCITMALTRGAFEKLPL
jgi:hypothetical protein